MIPRLGDEVVIDQWYEDLLLDARPEDFTVVTSPLKVVHLGAWSPDLTEVTVYVRPCGVRVFLIDSLSGRCHGADASAPPLFMPSLDALRACWP